MIQEVIEYFLKITAGDKQVQKVSTSSPQQRIVGSENFRVDALDERSSSSTPNFHERLAIPTVHKAVLYGSF